MLKFIQNKPEIAVLMGIGLFSVTIGGGLISNFKNYETPFITNKVSGICCDSGDGPNCHPIADSAHPTITFTSPRQGVASYGLLKSNITIADCAKHLKDSGAKGPNNEPIIIDTSNELAGNAGGETCNGAPLNVNEDTLADYRGGGGTSFRCVAIPDDEVIYACKSHCYPAPNGSTNCDAHATDYYGDGSTVYDVYFRIKDMTQAPAAPPGTVPGVPDVIKNCQGAADPGKDTQNTCILPTVQYLQRLTPVPYPSHSSLQLHTFPFGVTPTGCPVQWIRPWCKPAIYMYPPQKTSVTVKIAPQGKLKKVIPDYSSDGWQVIADPDGTITDNGKTYPYLYYAASIPDQLVPQQKDGYVVEYAKLNDLFNTVLPKLGLNSKEKNDFSAYWLKALPKANYYFVSVIPQPTLNNITPLYFNPMPNTIIRVTLNFEALDKPIIVKPPTIPTVERKGFTVIEWGGMVKQDPNHPFTCLE